MKTKDTISPSFFHERREESTHKVHPTQNDDLQALERMIRQEITLPKGSSRRGEPNRRKSLEIFLAEAKSSCFLVVEEVETQLNGLKERRKDRKSQRRVAKRPTRRDGR